MQNQILSIGEISSVFGVSRSTLRRWHKQKLLKPSFITPGGHRRYNLEKVAPFFGIVKRKNRQSNKRIVIAYSRVSSSDQRDDLKRQEKYLRSVLKKEKFVPIN